MPRIGNPGMMQPEYRIAQAQFCLDIRPQRNPPAAIGPVVGHVIAMPYRFIRAVDLKAADRSGDMAHVEAADQIVGIADAAGMHVVRGQQQPWASRSRQAP